MKKYLCLLIMGLFLAGCGGSGYEAGKKAENAGNLDKALKIYKRACKSGDIKACEEAIFKSSREDAEALGKMLLANYNKSCLRDGNISSCEISLYEADEKELPKISKKFNDLILKGCKGKDASICFLGFKDAGISSDDVAKFQEKRVKAVESNCKNKNVEFCLGLANFYQRGIKDSKGFDILEANKEKAEEFAQRAKTVSKELCEKGKDEGCEFLIRNHRRSDDLGLVFFDKACNKGSALACLKASDDSEDAAKIAYLDKACKLKNAPACENLMESYRDGSDGWFYKLKVEKDQKKAKEYLKKLCAIDKTNDYCK